jgi:hypothetical protein
MNHIHKVGVEIEGGWNSGNLPPPEPGSAHSDGSVSFSESGITSREYVSHPTENLIELDQWMRRVYPPHTNSTCGLHVHVSLKNPINYARIIDRRFQEFFLEEMAAWGKRRTTNKHFFSRLAGENKFCKKEWKPEMQIKATSKGTGERWTQWNFCWGLHKTAECRMLPTFKDVNIAVDGVTRIVKCVEDYLTNSPIHVAFTAQSHARKSELPPELLELMQ